MSGRVLVVYFSRSGTTRVVAEAIAQILGGDLEEITESRTRTGVVGFLRSLVESFEKRPSTDARWHSDPSAYDLIVIGTPVWAWSISSPVLAYLTANRVFFRDLAFFCTFGGTGGESVLAQMQKIAGKAPRAVLAVTQSDVGSEGYKSSLETFASALQYEDPAAEADEDEP